MGLLSTASLSNAKECSRDEFEAQLQCARAEPQTVELLCVCPLEEGDGCLCNADWKANYSSCKYPKTELCANHRCWTELYQGEGKDALEDGAVLCVQETVFRMLTNASNTATDSAFTGAPVAFSSWALLAG